MKLLCGISFPWPFNCASPALVTLSVLLLGDSKRLYGLTVLIYVPIDDFDL